MALELGSSYTITVERKRLVTRQLSGQWQADWQFVITNSQDQAISLILEDTDRSLLDVEFSKNVKWLDGNYLVTVPAGKTSTVTFTSSYRKN